MPWGLAVTWALPAALAVLLALVSAVAVRVRRTRAATGVQRRRRRGAATLAVGRAPAPQPSPQLHAPPQQAMAPAAAAPVAHAAAHDAWTAAVTRSGHAASATILVVIPCVSALACGAALQRLFLAAENPFRVRVVVVDVLASVVDSVSDVMRAYAHAMQVAEAAEAADAAGVGTDSEDDDDEDGAHADRAAAAATARRARAAARHPLATRSFADQVTVFHDREGHTTHGARTPLAAGGAALASWAAATGLVTDFVLLLREDVGDAAHGWDAALLRAWRSGVATSRERVIVSGGGAPDGSVGYTAVAAARLALPLALTARPLHAHGVAAALDAPVPLPVPAAWLSADLLFAPQQLWGADARAPPVLGAEVNLDPATATLRAYADGWGIVCAPSPHVFRFTEPSTATLAHLLAARPHPSAVGTVHAAPPVSAARALAWMQAEWAARADLVAACTGIDLRAPPSAQRIAVHARLGLHTAAPPPPHEVAAKFGSHVVYAREHALASTAAE